MGPIVYSEPTMTVVSLEVVCIALGSFAVSGAEMVSTGR